MVIHVQMGQRGRKADRIVCESIFCKTKRLFTCLSNRKTEKLVLSFESVRGIFFMEQEKKHMLDVYTRTWVFLKECSPIMA